MRRALVALSAVVLASCVAPGGYRHAAVPEVPIVPDDASGSGDAASRSHRVEVAPAASDDEMLRAFLVDAREKGAAHVSGVSLHETAERAGGTVTCRRSFVPRASTDTELVPTMRHPAPETRVVMRSVSRMEPSVENRCETVMRPVMRTETVWSTQYDSFTRSTRSSPQTRTVTQMQPSLECRPVTTMKLVSRFEPVTETVASPPRLEWIPVTHVQWQLTEEPPRCESAPGAAPSRWVEGLLHVPAPAASPGAPAAAPPER